MFPASRRDFLRTTGTAAAAAGLAHFAYAASSDTLKVGLIGCGGRGTGAALNALNADKDVKLVAMCDVFPDRLEGSLTELRDKAGDKVAADVRKYTDFDGYKQLIDSDVDVVLLCTPPGFRPTHLRYAAEKGKHIFCEKPMAVDAPGVRHVMESAKLVAEKNRCLMSGFCYRSHLPKREAMMRLHEGQIGDIVSMQVCYNTGPIWHRGGDANNPDMTYQMRNWYYYAWLSGDFIVEQHCHNLDKASWAMKNQYPEAAVALGGRQVRTEKKFGNIFDHFAVVFEYPSGVRLFSYCRQQANCATEISDRIFCTKGLLYFNDTQQIHQITGAVSWEQSNDKSDMYQTEHDELFAAIRAGKTINHGDFMANSTLMAIMGRTAAYTGKRITWKQMLASQETLGPKEYKWGPLDVAPVAMPGKTKFS